MNGLHISIAANIALVIGVIILLVMIVNKDTNPGKQVLIQCPNNVYTLEKLTDQDYTAIKNMEKAGCIKLA